MLAKILITSAEGTSYAAVDVTAAEFNLLKKIESSLIRTFDSPEFKVLDQSQIETEAKAIEEAMQAAEAKQLEHALGHDVESKSVMQAAFEKAMKKSK